MERLQEIMTAYMEKQLKESLLQVEIALVKWRKGDLETFDTHAELLRHAAEADHLAGRMARIGLDNASGVLRDAFDAGLIDEEEFVRIVGKRPSLIDPSPAFFEGASDSGVPDKKTLVEELLSGGPVLLHIDARHSLAQVPEGFRDDAKLILRFGYDLLPAITDLDIDKHGIYGTLTFGGVPWRCVLPWGCIYSVVSEMEQKGMVWPDDVPKSVVEEIDSMAKEKEEEKAPKLTSVTSEDDNRKPPFPTPPKGGHLKLVK